ncbi:MAG: alpha/beta hydrolase [Fibrobacterota bacterium]|nr:alpha/beta hydrolase [Fibrobacterota bacterium]
MNTTQLQITDSMQAVLDKYAELHPLPMETLTPEHARQLPALSEGVKGVLGSLIAKRSITPNPEPVAKVEHRLIPGTQGDILVRIYTPKGEGPFPILLYFHGGGWVIANLDAYDSSCRSLANLSDCMVVSVAYSQAPEHRFPIAIEQGFSVYQWLLGHASEVEGDPSRIAVGGESAGGNMAAVVSMLCRDRGMAMPLHQLLIYPVTDFSFDTPSYLENADAKPLSRDMMKWFCRHYLENQGEASNPYASPLRARDLSRLPSATVITAEIDPLRSEGEAYAKKLEEARVPVRFRNYEGVTHEFFGMKAVLPEAKEANEFAADGLKGVWDR